MCDNDKRQAGATDKEASSDLDAAPDIDAQLDCGVAVLHASGRLRYEDAGVDRLLVLDIVDAVAGGRAKK
jgi:hypothetical protein